MERTLSMNYPVLRQNKPPELNCSGIYLEEAKKKCYLNGTNKYKLGIWEKVSNEDTGPEFYLLNQNLMVPIESVEIWIYQIVLYCACTEPTSSDDLITPSTRLGHKKRCCNYFVSKELRPMFKNYLCCKKRF